MRELSVVGPAQTPSSVCTHCLSGSCDQHRGHKEVGTLLNSPGQGLLGEVTRMYHRNRNSLQRETSASHSQPTCQCRYNIKKFFKGRGCKK